MPAHARGGGGLEEGAAQSQLWLASVRSAEALKILSERNRKKEDKMIYESVAQSINEDTWTKSQ